MNKTQLLESIALLAIALDKEVITKDLNVDALNVLHDELIEEKKALDESLAEKQSEESLSKQEKVVLKFVAPHKRYSNGDIAGFDADTAGRILALQPAVAETYQEEQEQ